MHDRIKRQLWRHGWWAFGFANRARFESQIDTGFVRCDRFTAGILQQTSGYPPFKNVDLLVRQRRLVGRHRRLFGMCDGLDEFAAVGAAGDEDLSRAAAFQGTVVAGEVEITFLFVGIVTPGAVIIDQRQDVGLIRNFLLRERACGHSQPRENYSAARKRPCRYSRRHTTAYHQSKYDSCKPRLVV